MPYYSKVKRRNIMSNSMLYSNEHHKNEKTEVEEPLYNNYFHSRGKCETEDKTGH